MEENKHMQMENPKKIIRKSIYTFLQNYQYFTTTPLLLIFPFSASILLSQDLSSSPCSSFLIIQIWNHSQILKTNVFHTILTCVIVLFLSLTTLLTAKAVIIQTLFYPKTSPSLPFSSFKSLLRTQLCNFFIMIILNAVYISLLYIIFPQGSSSNRPIFWAGISYSFFANASVICNLALVVSETEDSFAFSAILKACSLCWNTNCTILLTNLPTNLGMFATEALFGYRIVRAYREKGFFEPSMAMEGILIAYLYSVLVILDTIASCVFFKGYKVGDQTDCKGQYCYQIVLVNKQDYEISVLVK